MKYKNILIGDLSGSMSGLVASTNRFGNYFRNKGLVTNPNSPAQVAIRTGFGVSSLVWRLISQSQRDAWIAYADATPLLRKGKMVIMTGLNMFVRSNSVRFYNGQTTISDGPVNAGLPEFTAVTAVASLATGVTVTIDPADDWATDNLGAMYSQVSDGQSPSINFFKSPFRPGGGVQGADVGPIPDTFIIPVGNGWAINKKIFLTVNVTDAEGRVGQKQTLELIIVA